ncbi:unnamed protein product [Phytophthora fragariaefolia]|uniref:Mitochondrial pyruvate carrier n=1 Tax=Phytophthora fragariaefolia TaxID=1490495 RepID=A0A9W6Y2Z1_9STRA|nr:unnamed protein product [Phytophthora fragariaefolia]
MLPSIVPRIQQKVLEHQIVANSPKLAAVAGGGLIWSRYSTVITPVNWNLLAVNFFMAGTGIVQLYRKFEHERSMARATEAAKTQYGNAAGTAKAAVDSATL